jgi:hypothetical protein
MADEWDDDDELDVAQLQSEAAAAAAPAAAAAAHGNDDEDAVDWEDGDAAPAEGMLQLLYPLNHLHLSYHVSPKLVIVISSISDVIMFFNMNR